MPNDLVALEYMLQTPVTIKRFSYIRDNKVETLKVIYQILTYIYSILLLHVCAYVVWNSNTDFICTTSHTQNDVTLTSDGDTSNVRNSGKTYVSTYNIWHHMTRKKLLKMIHAT